MKIMGYEIKETEPRKAFRIKRDNITLKEPETNKKAKEQFQRKPYYLQTIKQHNMYSRNLFQMDF